MRRLLFCAIAVAAALPCGADTPSRVADAETDTAFLTLEEAARSPVLLGPERLEEVARCLRPMSRADQKRWLERLRASRRARFEAALLALRKSDSGAARVEYRAAGAARREVSALPQMITPRR
jgi:hypothetical protein